MVLSKFSARHVARVLRIFLKADPVGGARAGGMLLECLAPTFTIRCGAACSRMAAVGGCMARHCCIAHGAW